MRGVEVESGSVVNRSAPMNRTSEWAESRREVKCREIELEQRCRFPRLARPEGQPINWGVVQSSGMGWEHQHAPFSEDLNSITLRLASRSTPLRDKTMQQLTSTTRIRSISDACSLGQSHCMSSRSKPCSDTSPSAICTLPEIRYSLDQTSARGIPDGNRRLADG